MDRCILDIATNVRSNITGIFFLKKSSMMGFVVNDECDTAGAALGGGQRSDKPE